MSDLIDASTRSVTTGLLQRTLKSPIHCNGIGLHSGSTINMTLVPADPDTGILFRRIDLKNGARDIRARYDAVIDTRLCTTIANDHHGSVATVEHLMAALAGCGVDNVVVELDGPEVPVMDGSSAVFVEAIKQVGLNADLIGGQLFRTKRDSLRRIEWTRCDAAALEAGRNGGIGQNFRREAAELDLVFGDEGLQRLGVVIVELGECVIVLRRAGRSPSAPGVEKISPASSPGDR